MSDNQPRLLVTGASGQLGQRVLELLLESKVTNVIATTRNPEKLSEFAARGVEVRHADFDDPTTLPDAFAGADRILLISTDAVDGSDKRLNQHQAAVKAAEVAGVKHVIYTSMVNADDTPVKFAGDHYGTERALAESSLNWTVLRCNLYADLLLMGLSQAYQMGGLFNASGDGKTAYVTREDCARAAFGALMSSFSGQRILDVTGVEALSQADIAALATSITGQALNHVPVELAAIIDGMEKAGLPRFLAEIYASIDVAIAEGKFEVVSNAAEELSGQKPTSVEAFLSANKETLMQSVSAS